MRNLTDGARFSIFHDLGPDIAMCHLDGVGATSASEAAISPKSLERLAIGRFRNGYGEAPARARSATKPLQVIGSSAVMLGVDLDAEVLTAEVPRGNQRQTRTGKWIEDGALDRAKTPRSPV